MRQTRRVEQATIAIFIFAAASFFFALAETALFSLTKWQVGQLAEQHPHRGKILAQLLARPEDLLATLVLGNTFANAAMLALALRLSFNTHWVLALVVITLAVIVLLGCEVFPKTLAVRRPDSWALRVVWPLFLFEKITKPFYKIAQWLNSAVLKKAAKQSATSAKLSDAEYHELLNMAAEQGTLAESEKEIILQIINLDQRVARDVMRPRAGMACVSDEATVEEMIAAAKQNQHRRLPIYDETPDTIVGILNTRALLLNPKIDLADAIEFPSFVPETMNLLLLFRALQKQQRGLAIVLDEFGGTAGVVTMEDILGELVGKIRSHKEAGGFVMEKLAPYRWRVNGTMRLDDFRREYPTLPEVESVETMGGLLTHLLGVVPDANEFATFAGLKLTAQIADGRRVNELLVQKVK
ncbi:MAG TPA: hemolysin family protein [Candidatus Acidoferrales bacterium]|nr:hemolysin family protein [Candidatus Acidoferrales bacterium]